MTRLTRFPSASDSPRRRNFLAIIISFVAISILFFNFEPMPAGVEPDGFSVDLAQFTTAGFAPSSLPGPGPVVTDPAAGNEDDHYRGARAATTNIVEGRLALLMNMMLLERAVVLLENTSDYTATFHKQERVNGTFLAPEVIQLKIRHEPFSVYMKWAVGDKGRELLYLPDRYDGKLLVKVGGIKGRLLPSVKLNPHGSTAMRQSRHPITKVGLLNLAREIMGYRRAELAAGTDIHCQMLSDQLMNERVCYCFILDYPSPDVSEVYRKTVQYIDKETFFPICIRNYTWPNNPQDAAKPNLDESTLIEHYSYWNIQRDQQLTDADFDRKNRKYNLRR